MFELGTLEGNRAHLKKTVRTLSIHQRNIFMQAFAKGKGRITLDDLVDSMSLNTTTMAVLLVERTKRAHPDGDIDLEGAF